jgi:hypothetical protein
MTVTFIAAHFFHEKEKKLYKTSSSRKERMELWGGRISVMDQIALSGLAFCFSPLVVSPSA